MKFSSLSGFRLRRRLPLSNRIERLLAVMWLSIIVNACGPVPDPADLVLIGGRIITLSDRGVVEGIAIRDERIVAVGSDADVRQ